MNQVVVLLASFSALLAVASGFPKSCPSDENLHPCTCKRMAYGLHVYCANFNQNSDLFRAFRVLRDYEVQKVLLHGLNFTKSLPLNTFEGLNINELRVEKSKLKFEGDAFAGLDNSLHILNVAQHSVIKSSENFSLAPLTKLTELNIKSNYIKRVSDRWLNGKIPNVHTITLDEDHISEIEDKVFASLTHLKYVSMADNFITKVTRSMFPRPANYLRTIDLSGNQISSLPGDFFILMPSIREIILSGNKIQSLPKTPWESIWNQLDKILLVENNLNCNNALNWLKDQSWPSTVIADCLEPEDKRGKSLMEVYNT